MTEPEQYSAPFFVPYLATRERIKAHLNILWKVESYPTTANKITIKDEKAYMN